MSSTNISAPPPDLRILPVEQIYPHEEHDTQRSQPLLQVLAKADLFTNPPIVAEVAPDEFVLMDGANRYHCFCDLGYKHLLVQVTNYKSPFVELGVWQHVVTNWSGEAFYQALLGLTDIRLKQGWDHTSVAQILLNDGHVVAVDAPNHTVMLRNTVLRQIVGIYQRQATLNRTALTDPTVIWPLYPDASALVLFPTYHPEDIIAAAREHAYLPPGVSRHIIHGRALKLNYPMANLKDEKISLEAKNAHLQAWAREKISHRAVRYYAESTYQFDE